jgi:hypothetical protein
MGWFLVNYSMDMVFNTRVLAPFLPLHQYYMTKKNCPLVLKLTLVIVILCSITTLLNQCWCPDSLLPLALCHSYENVASSLCSRMNINVNKLKPLVTELQNFLCNEENYGNMLCMQGVCTYSYRLDVKDWNFSSSMKISSMRLESSKLQKGKWASTLQRWEVYVF